MVAIARSSGEIVAVARYSANRCDLAAADIAVVVDDHWQGRGLGLALTRLVVWRAATTGFTRLVATVLEDNLRALSLLRKLGFEPWARQADVVEVRLELAAAYSAASTASSSSTTSPSSFTAAIRS